MSTKLMELNNVKAIIKKPIGMGEANDNDVLEFVSSQYFTIKNDELNFKAGLEVTLNRASNGWPEITFENGDKFDVAIDDNELETYFDIK